GIVGRRRRPVDFDRLDVGDGETLEARATGSGTAAAVGVGVGRAHAVDGDAHVLVIHAAESRAARLRLDVVEVNAGEVFQELADIAGRHVAKDVGRNR